MDRGHTSDPKTDRGASGPRVEKCIPNCTSPTTYTVYLFSGSKVIAEYDNGAAVTSPSREYIYSGAVLLAKIDSSGTKYYHQDHLSNRLVTNSSGTTVAQMGHFPYGETWYNATNDKFLFTTYERDSESGSDYAQARSYVNRLARFSSPDPIAGSTSDPQSLNRYSYVRNMPPILVDPSGQTVCNSVQQNPNQDDTSSVGGNGPGPSLGEMNNDSAAPQSGSGCWQASSSGGGGDSFYLDGGDFTDYSGYGLGSQPGAWDGWSPGQYVIYGLYPDDGYSYRVVGFGFFFPPGSFGDPSGDSFKDDLYKKYIKELNDCVQKVFSWDYKNGKVPNQNLGNSPALDTSKTGNQLLTMCRGADKTIGCNAPPTQGGSNGTIFIASEKFSQTGPNALVENYAYYVHELGNILDARAYPRVGTDSPFYESHHSSSHLEDQDTGANLEDCFLKAIKNSH